MTLGKMLFKVMFVERADGGTELDLGWLILGVAFLNGIVAFDLTAAGYWHITVAAWSWYGSLTGLAFIAGATISRARLMADSTTPGEVGGAIASAPPTPLAYREIDEPDA